MTLCGAECQLAKWLVQPVEVKETNSPVIALLESRKDPEALKITTPAELWPNGCLVII